MHIDSPTPKMVAELNDGIAWITFNNPARHNAMSLDMWQGLAAILKKLEGESTLRVAILQGAGEKAFVSGADISEFESKRNSQAQRDAYEAAFDDALTTLATFAKPVIAMIQGYCVGGGLAIALNTDVRIATDDSRFAIPAAKLGLGYGYESIKTLTSIVGPAFAKDILFSARLLDTTEALRMGLVNQVFARGVFADKVLEYANTVASNAPLTIKSVKAAITEIIKDPGQPSRAHIENLVNACFNSEDYREGRQAFMEKRKPVFKGR